MLCPNFGYHALIKVLRKVQTPPTFHTARRWKHELQHENVVPASLTAKSADISSEQTPQITARLGRTAEWLSLPKDPPFAGRQRLSSFWIPSIAARKPLDLTKADSNELLQRCGFYTSPHAGIFQMLPLGLRVQEKLETLIGKHMRAIGASKLSLSSFSSPELWKKTGRFEKIRSELFQLKDRKNAKLILSPTHEEEVTAVVKGLVHSYRDLPLRLYQISRKYRDERRPREGLLRAREFLMKDLYTFDWSLDNARKTYDAVREAYSAFFTDLKLPWIAADASSGAMGGHISHEYHVPTSKGEDRVFTCKDCGYAANEELAVRKEEHENSIHSFEMEQLAQTTWLSHPTSTGLHHELFVTNEKDVLVVVCVPAHQGSEPTSINPYQLRQISTLDHLDTGVENPMEIFRAQVSARKASGNYDQDLHIIYVLDKQIRSDNLRATIVHIDDVPIKAQILKSGIDLVGLQAGDKCPNVQCNSGRLEVQSYVELGHTFFLGTRYSSALNALVSSPEAGKTKAPALQRNSQVPLQMGCHGIGLSRIIATAADLLKDKKGLNWPRAMAPFEVVIIPGPEDFEHANEVYDALSGSSPSIDCVIDDRDHSPGSKMKDAQLVGFPIIVRIGKRWHENPRRCLVSCRRPGVVDEDVAFKHLKPRILTLLEPL